MAIKPVQLLNNNASVLLGMVYNYLPFMIFPIYTTLQKIPKDIIEAAEDLGANNKVVFKKITLPLVMPGIISGITMVFVPAITTFAISRLLGGAQYMLYGDLIENQFIAMNNPHSGSALSLIMLILVVISMVVMQKMDGDHAANIL